MTPDELRLKHSPLELSQGKTAPVAYCKGCSGPNANLTVKWPCDLIKFFECYPFKIDPEYRVIDERYYL